MISDWLKQEIWLSLKNSLANRHRHKRVRETNRRPDLIQQLLTQTHCALDLDRQIAGVTFFFNERDYEQSDVKPPRHPLSFCMMVNLSTKGRCLKLKEGQVSCPGAKRALGLTPPDDDFRTGNRYFSFGLYKSLKTAKNTASSVTLMPTEVYGLAIQPLASCDKPPHVVIVICNPYQAMRLIQGYTYHFGPAPQILCNGMQGLCSELTARPFQTQGINVSLLCSNTRFSCSWKDAELGVGMPFEMFPKVVDGVIETLNSTEPDKRKKEMIKRADLNETKVNIKLGNAYYVKKPECPARPSSVAVPLRRAGKRGDE